MLLDRTVSYSFAHIALPILSLGNPNKLYKDLSNSGSSYLLTIWKGLERRMNQTENSGGLSIALKALRGNYSVFIISMPHPKLPPEAIFIGLLFDITSKLFSKTAKSCRYFTLEHGLHPIDGKIEYHICEWKGVPPKEHINYGKLPNAELDTFLNTFLDISSSSTIKSSVIDVDPLDNQNSINQLFDTGLLEARKGNFNEAIIGFSKYITVNPTDATAFYNRGKARINHGEYYDAVLDFSTAMSINPNEPDYYNNRGIARRHMGDLKGAIADYSMALSLDSSLYITYLNRGIARFEIEDYQGACDDFRIAYFHGVPGALDALLQADCK